jgi:hypothetical protein
MRRKETSELVFRCPYTNKRLSSGIEIDRDNARHIRELPLLMQCPYCGLHHDGVIGDGELRDAVAQSR